MNRRRMIWLAAANTVLAVIGGAWWANRRLAPAVSAHGDLPVAITSPRLGQHVSAGEPVMVEAMAGTGRQLASLELWADGSLVDASWPSGPDDGWEPLATFSWIPQQAGTTVLIARAREPNGLTHDSTPVPVLVDQGVIESEPGSAPQQARWQVPRAGGSGQAPQVLPGPAGPPLPASVPPPDGSVPPARSWQPNLANVLSRAGDVLSPRSPAAMLEARLDGCAVVLTVGAANAGGYGVLLERISLGQPIEVTELDTIDLPAGSPWASYRDENPPAGSVQYQASLITPDGKYTSNLALVEVPAQDCPQDELATEVSLLHLVPNPGAHQVDRAYCYVSQNGLPFERWPAVGFLKRRGRNFGSAGQIAEIAFSPEELAAGDLRLECWGWSGDQLEPLGSFEGSGDTLVENPSWSTDLGKATLEIQTGALQAGDLLPVLQSALFAARMPPVHAELSFDPDVCGNHLPKKAQNLLGKVLFCTPYPIYDVGEQPYLVWSFQQGTCPLGHDCLSIAALQDLAKLNNAEVGVGVYDQSNGMMPFLERSFDLSMYLVWPPDPEFYCGIQRSYAVRIFYRGQPYGEGFPYQTVRGPSSNVVSIPFDCPPPSGALIEVTFDHIHFGHLDDGLGDDELEVYGALFAKSSQSGGLGNKLLISAWGAPYGSCVGDYDNWSLTNEALCPQKIGTYYQYNLDFNFPWPMCASSTLDCPGFHWFDDDRSIDVYVEDGDAILVGIMMYDYDELSGNDEVCVVTTWTPHLSSSEWGSQQNAQWWMYQGDNGNASCELYWHTTAKEVYY